MRLRGYTKEAFNSTYTFRGYSCQCLTWFNDLFSHNIAQILFLTAL